jgi:ABC-type uncharacterized transport system auxiliary subunit
MSKLIQVLIIILLMIAIAFISRGIKKIVIQPETISVEKIAQWCDEAPNIYECRKFKINNRRDK